MNALRNSVRLIGHLGDAPKVIQFESGRKIVNFSIATNETYVLLHNQLHNKSPGNNYFFS